ncbi:hypothetical protein AADZ91_07975 [Colwelliaceae bacterium 6441]
MKIEVVVVGSGLNALGIMRSLGREFRTLLVTRDGVAGRHTKYGQKQVVLSTTDNTIITDLITLGAKINGKALLFLSEEKTVELLSEHRAELAQYYQFLLPNHEQVVALQSKSGFQEVAEQAKSLIPKALIVSQATDADAELLTFPCCFKPLYQDKEYSKHFKKAYKLNSWEDVKALYAKISPIMPDMILQEWIEGEDSDIYFNLMYVSESGEIVTSFSGRKVRSWPLNVGGTASCTASIEHHTTLHEQTKAFVEATDYVGLIGMEYKYDVERKGFYMIEPTVGRTDYQHEVATLSGCNILLAIARYHIQGKVERCFDANTYRQVLWYDEISDANALANGGAVLSNEPTKKIGALFRWSDIGPYVFSFKEKIKRRLKLG